MDKIKMTIDGEKVTIDGEYLQKIYSEASTTKRAVLEAMFGDKIKETM